jgi:hypothetical protein
MRPLINFINIYPTEQVNIENRTRHRDLISYSEYTDLVHNGVFSKIKNGHWPAKTCLTEIFAKIWSILSPRRDIYN